MASGDAQKVWFPEMLRAVSRFDGVIFTFGDGCLA